MDDKEDDARYRTNPRGGNQQSIYGSSLNIQKLPIRYQCIDNDEVVDDEEEMGDEVDVKNRRNNGIRGGSNDFDDEEDEDDFDDGNDNEDDDNPHPRTNFGGSVGDSERRLKKWKLKSLISSYEFAPCVPASQVDPLAAAAQSSAPQVILWRSEHTDWTETETFVLLDAWGDQFLQHGRKSLRFEEWHEVAEKVSEVSKIERTDAQSGIAWTH